MFNWINRLFTRRFGNTWFYPTRFDSFQLIDYYKAYASIPEVNAVINIKARAFSNMQIQGRADVVKLFNEPNWYQSGLEFIHQAKLQREVFGNEFIYVLKPVGMASVKAMYVLPSEKVKVKASDKLFFTVTEPQVEYLYDDLKLPKEQVIHFTSERIAGDVVGISPLHSLTVSINNLRLAYESRGVILRYRGALGILTNKAKDGIGNPFPIDPKERERIQEEYRKYGLNSDQFQIIITDQPLEWQQMTVEPDRLGLFEETKEALNKILDKYGVPADLMTRQQGSTYENQRQAERGFYIRTIIPEANEWIKGLNTYFDSDLVATFDHLSIFQDDLKIRNEMLNSRVNALSRLFQEGVITIEEYRDEIQNYL